MPEIPDIGQLASIARTALDDPGALPEKYAHLPIEPQLSRDPRGHLALDCLDQIIAVTDPGDDEREIERCSDSLDALGRHVERIREQFSELHGQGTELDEIVAASNHVTVALDLIDQAASVLREIASEPEHECEDCSVNGDDCREHGEAFHVARREILNDPERVLALLTEREVDHA